MAFNQINLTEQSKKTLARVDSIVNDKPTSTASDRVNEALSLLSSIIKHLDEESFANVTGYSKF